jgi:chromosome segregation ATPase
MRGRGAIIVESSTLLDIIKIIASVIGGIVAAGFFPFLISWRKVRAEREKSQVENVGISVDSLQKIVDTQARVQDAYKEALDDAAVREATAREREEEADSRERETRRKVRDLESRLDSIDIMNLKITKLIKENASLIEQVNAQQGRIDKLEDIIKILTKQVEGLGGTVKIELDV